jgi:hypothetical protein
MSDAKKLDQIANIGRVMIERQLVLAAKTPEEALSDIWVLGYCFGMFDAMAQRAELDQYSEGFALITISFLQLMSDHTEAADKVRQALDNQNDARFEQGNRTAGADLFAWFADTNKSPLSLYDYLKRELAWGAKIAVAFERLRQVAPGAAYLFARTLANARSFVDDQTVPKSRKIEAIQAQISADAAAKNPDAGIPNLAMTFIRRLLEAEGPDRVGHLTAFADIAKAGEAYRALEPRDRQPPVDEGSRGILAKQGRTCIAEVVDAVMAECQEMAGDRTRALDDTATMLALFDLREEVSSGRLQSVLPGLRSAINGSG